MQVKEIYVNRTANYRYDESPIYRVAEETPGKLFRVLQSEFGRCESKMYRDNDGKAEQIGWVFARMSRYEDRNLKSKEQWYCREVWVTVYDDNNQVMVLN